MPFPALVKAAALGAAAVTGVAGIAWSASAGPSGSEPGVWVDGPLEGTAVVPGLVPVTAHASAKDPVSQLVLLVDGKQVAQDSDLERRGLLSLGTFAWEAAAGTHALVVQAGGARSDVVHVYVSERGAAAPPTTAPKPTVTARPATPTASPTSSPTPSPTPSPTRAVVVPSATPSRTPSPTPKPSPPVIGSSAFDPPSWYWDSYYSSSTQCSPSLPQQSRASVTVSNATSVQVVVNGHAFTASRSGTTWTATVRSEDLPGKHIDTYAPVVIRATGPGGTVSRDAGTVLVRSCEKD